MKERYGLENFGAYYSEFIRFARVVSIVVEEGRCLKAGIGDILDRISEVISF